MKIKVTVVWMENDEPVGARLCFNGNTDRLLDLSIDDIRQQYAGKLANADITPEGLKPKPGVELDYKPLARQTGEQVATYTLMHADEVVCRVYPLENKVTVTAAQYLPFALTGAILTATAFERWLTYRIDNLSRTYMNRVYIARKVGRDREKILKDSCALSIIDNFWVKRSDVDTTWAELNNKRDSNLDLVDVALTGTCAKPPDFTKTEEDTTSLFALKGAFPKAVYKDNLLKKDNNAVYDTVAYQLGRVLGVSVAKAVKLNGMVTCELFTNAAVSMVHARDLLHLTDYVSGIDDEHRAMYDYFANMGRDAIVRQLERLYIFNYLVENLDFHYENFGILYDSTTFEFIRVAPAYDFNSAFAGYNDVTVFYAWILGKLPLFMRNHGDIRARLQSADFLDVLKNIIDLTAQQINSLRERAVYLCGL